MKMDKPVLEDVIEKGVVTLFCGSAAGNASARLRQYYAGRGNQFWPILYKSGFTKNLLTPREYGQVVNFRIGLTDLAKFEHGNDSQISSHAYQSAPLLEKIEYYQPRFLALVSKAVAKFFMSDRFGIQSIAYGKQNIDLHQTQIWVLPSTSARAKSHWQEKPWHDLANHHNQHIESLQSARQ